MKKYRDNKNTGLVSLWDLITVMSFFFVLGNTIAYIKITELKTIHIFISLLIGCIVGIICVKIIRITGKSSRTFIEKYFSNTQEFVYNMLYLLVFLWIIVSALLNNFILTFIFE